MKFNFRISCVGDDDSTIIIDLIGGILTSNLDDFRLILDAQYKRDVRNVILNCEELDFLGSNAIGCLVEINDKIGKRGNTLWFAAVNKEIMDVFENLTIDHFFKICAGKEDVLARIESGE